MSTRPTLPELLRGRSRAALARFVGALHAARGADVSVEGRIVVVDGERLLVVSPRRFALADRLRAELSECRRIDGVVAVDAKRAGRIAARYDARPVSAVDLDRIARYGLDRSVADDVYRDAFGRPVSAVEPGAPAAPASDGSASRSPSIVGVVVGLVALALVGATVAGAGAAASPLSWVLGQASEASPAATPGDVSPSVGGNTSVASAGATGTADTDPVGEVSPPSADADTSKNGSDVGFSPGLTTAGVTNVDALAGAHAAVLGNGSYRWELSYVESVNGSVTARGTEVVHVESPRRFVSTVDWAGSPVGFTPLATRSSYADGTRRYRPDAEAGVVSHALSDFAPAGQQGWRASRYLRWYLSTESSSIVRTLDHTRQPIAVVVLNGTDYAPAKQYTARAYVTSDGLVRGLTVSYTLTRNDESRPVLVRFSFEYHVDEDVSAPPPRWFVEAQEDGTDG